MYIFKCKGTWIYSGQYNLYLSSTLIKNSIFCCVAPGHWDSRKIKFCAMFSKSSLFKIEYSINIETQCLKNIQLYSKPHFHIFTRKKGPLPMLPESPIKVQWSGQISSHIIQLKEELVLFFFLKTRKRFSHLRATFDMSMFQVRDI